MLKKVLVAIAMLAATTGHANAHSMGIGDSISGSSASIYMNSYHSNAGVEGGIILTGPGQPAIGSLIAFDVDYSGGATPVGFDGIFDAEPDTIIASQDWQGINLTGLANGFYSYVFTDLIGNPISPKWDSSNGLLSLFNGSFTISAVPLPAAFPLYGAGIALLGFIGWRRKQRQAEA